MTGARLVLVPVPDVACSWCGYPAGHDPRCYMARVPVREPTSREQFAAAQRAGETVGHEWGRQQRP